MNDKCEVKKKKFQVRMLIQWPKQLNTSMEIKI